MTEASSDPPEAMQAGRTALRDRDGPAIEVRGLRSVFGEHLVHEDLDLIFAVHLAG